MSSTKETLRQLIQLFTPSATNPFPSLVLPPSTQALLDEHLSQFAASFPLGGGGGHHRDTEGERERSRWRDGLTECWAMVEPAPGTETDYNVIAGVSAFLVLLDKMSAGLGDDDDSALVSRKDIATIWWGAVLKRTVLGLSSPEEGGAGGSGPRGGNALEKSLGRGRKAGAPATKKGKEVASPASTKPLIVSRGAMAAAVRMLVWGMTRSESYSDESNRDRMTAFGVAIFNEYEERAEAMLRGLDKRYGVRNLEECIVGWAGKSPKAFFLHVASFIEHTSASCLPFLSLLLAFLSRHSAKSYHALNTPLLKSLINVSLLSSSSAAVSISLKCLVILLVTLPVIIGESLFGIMAVYGRVVSWAQAEDSEEKVGNDQAPSTSPPPDPLVLFTVLYGIYPCNFTAFLKDPVNYLVAKGWKGPLGRGEIALDSAVVQDRSRPLIRLHTLHPSLITFDLATELTDTNRWSRFDSADVMAECDRNLVQVVEIIEARGGLPATKEEDTETDDGYTGRSRSTRAADRNDGQETPPAVDLDDSLRRSETPMQSLSRSRSPTPHMPATTHFANFQALQPGSPLRHDSRLASPHASDRQVEDDPLVLSRSTQFFPASANSSTRPSAENSRRSSFVAGVDLNLSVLSLTPSRVLNEGKEGEAVNLRGGGAVSKETVASLEAQLSLLQSEVNFQTYLKQLHLSHLGTLHREKVLESGAEAERQSLSRTIRTLRTQLQQTKSSLDKVRAESSVIKANWISHIDDMKEKLKVLREQKIKWEHEGGVLRMQVQEMKETITKQTKQLEEQGAAFLDQSNQVSIDKLKLDKITDYEKRIEALSKTLAICDEDLCKFSEQRRDMDRLSQEWKKADLLREAAEAEFKKLRVEVESKDAELHELRHTAQSSPVGVPLSAVTKDGLESTRSELERLRSRVHELEEENLELKESHA